MAKGWSACKIFQCEVAPGSKADDQSQFITCDVEHSALDGTLKKSVRPAGGPSGQYGALLGRRLGRQERSPRQIAPPLE